MEQTRRFSTYLIIPHADEACVLLLPHHAGWSLPHFQSAESHPGRVAHINRSVKELWGITATVLQCIRGILDPAAQTVQRVYTLENHDGPSAAPPPGRWMTRGQVATSKLSIPGHRCFINEWFAEQERGNLPPERVPWARPGWFAAARAWTDRQLGRLAIRPLGPWEQERAWTLSCILRVPTTAGQLYFKAVPPTFAYTPQLLQQLAARFPDCTPQILAIEATQGWTLMRDLGGATLEGERRLDRWAAAISAFARLQKATAREKETWLSVGCPEQSLGWMKGEIAPLLSRVEAMLPDRPKGLSSAEIVELQRLGPSLALACDRLADAGLPESLVHNDFHAGNIIATGARTVFFDWADSAVTCPLFSLSAMLDAENMRRGPLCDRLRLREAYLSAWTDDVPMPTLVAAADLALPLGALYHALNHLRVIDAIEPRSRWELDATVPYWLRKVLAHRDRLVGW
jgi:hypothetical protein